MGWQVSVQASAGGREPGVDDDQPGLQVGPAGSVRSGGDDGSSGQGERDDRYRDSGSAAGVGVGG